MAARQKTLRSCAGIGSDPTVADESGAEGTVSIVGVDELDPARGAASQTCLTLLTHLRWNGELGSSHFSLSGVVGVVANTGLNRFRLRCGSARAEDANQICTVDGNPLMEHYDEYSKRHVGRRKTNKESGQVAAKKKCYR